MALKFSLIVVACLLFGFVAFIPPVYSINCYRKVVEDGEVVVDEGVVQCIDPRDDKCGTLHFTVDSSIDVEIRNCTRSARDCHNGAVCGRVRKHVEAFGGSLTSCSAMCCDTENCNAPGAKKNTVMTLHGKKEGGKDGNNMREKLAKLISSRI